MDYLFDNVLLYRPNESVILFVGEYENSGITLTPVLNRILILLIEKKGQLVTREEFLKNVWDNHGRIASSNTLTQYISTLRKIFSDHLKKECIVNVPKKGYILSLEVNVVSLNAAEEVLTQVEAKPATISEYSRNVVTSESVEDHIIAHSSITNINKFKKLLIISFMMTVAGSTLFFLLPWQKFNQEKWSVSGRFGGCPIYLLPDYNTGSKVRNDLNMERVVNHIEKFDLQCIDGASFFFYNNNNTGIPVNSYSLLSRCVKGSDEHDECITTKISGH
ncbi:Transcriptional activator CadC [Serratia fonticola]|uniref:winged helix-turn-helix domain-containing protein n=1 Tax=Serratia fonticola TaxID=47917 RepID=UPI00217B9447|nr:helix-turn-helix domain-containing protein [Serratia fonticola]CAI2043836.1 Transcriptional activator CadC [Serratia fonticola]